MVQQHQLTQHQLTQHQLTLRDGRTLVAYDTAPGATEAPTLLWHHGSPQTGAPLEPLVRAAADRGIRLLSYARPSYGGSSAMRGRTVADAAADVEQIADFLAVKNFATMGASGGGPHALACAAVLPDRVTGVVCLAGIAPFTEEYDWYDGMAAPHGLKAARLGREERERYAEVDEFDPASFIAADYTALQGSWSSLDDDVASSQAFGAEGLIDDDIAFAREWGFDIAQITAPVLLVQGAKDRVVPPSHTEWLRGAIEDSELWLRSNDGHISVLGASALAMDWLLGKGSVPSEDA